MDAIKNHIDFIELALQMDNLGKIGDWGNVQPEAAELNELSVVNGY